MKIGLVTLFPELFSAFGSVSLVGRAVEQGKLELLCEDLRPHGLGRHLSVDDTPYGGGAGMVLRVDCVVSALEALSSRMLATADAGPEPAPIRRILLTPQGAPFTQRTAERWSQAPSLIFVCGRYEGFDERVRTFVDEEASLGDFVVIGGEVPAMAMIECVARLLPGVLGNEASALDESFSDGAQPRLEYPQYTRPLEFRGLAVPDVLRSGHHGEIAAYRRRCSEQRTQERRPELVARPRPELSTLREPSDA